MHIEKSILLKENEGYKSSHLSPSAYNVNLPTEDMNKVSKSMFFSFIIMINKFLCKMKFIVSFIKIF